MSESEYDLPPPPPIEDGDFLPTIPRKSEFKPEPPPRRKGGPPPVIPRNNSVPEEKTSIALRNNLLFMMSDATLQRGSEDFPPAAPSPEKQKVIGNRRDKEADSSAYSLVNNFEKPTLDIKTEGNMPMMTLKGPDHKFFERVESRKLDAFFEKPEPKRAVKALPEAPNYSDYDCKLFEAINQVRSKPTSFLPLLEERLLKFEKGTNNLVIGHNSRLVTHEGPPAVNEAIAFLKRVTPAKRLTWHNVLADVCKEHVEEIGSAGLYEHKMKDGTQPTDKAIEKLKEKVSTAAESIKFSSDDALTAVIDFIVDDGVKSRGNRNNVFGDWDHMGCFTGLHTISDTMTTFLFVQNASSSSNILQGLVAQINAQVEDPPNWAQKQQKVLLNGNEIVVTNTFLMKDGSQKTVEIKRKVQGNNII